ncbi:Glycosyltransferase involved in cell wall bisynthesis [Vreelandella titanicae]|uniref:glycosyltransferase n=1 Tax=Vreelandella titanicae TaxID=664683 RepID=UPI00088B16CD|nr:glycosyltransferase [Halomonas titanicae]SDI96778.1 Glycosyltransferase involved in cell wall bisynthesis [Halomonas titanicae]
MDELLNYAKQLAEQKIATLKAPIAKRIAYVVSHGQSYANNGYAIRTQGIAKALNDHGFETLCFVRPGRPWEFGAEQTVDPVIDIDGVRYIHSRWEKGISPQGEEKHLKASVDKFVELFNVFRPSVVLAGSNFIIGLPAYVAAKKLGIPFYNEIRGFWELSRAAREPGYELTESFKQEAARDAFVAKQAQRVFTLNQPMQQELVKRGVDEARVKIIANGVNKLPVIRPANEDLKRKLGIRPEDKVVGYVGSFNAYEGLDILVTACQTLIDEGVNVKLLLVGDDGVSEKLGGQTGEHRYPWLITTGRVPHEQVADYYALIDQVVIPRKSLPVCHLVPPMKAMEATAFNKPLLVSDVKALVDLKQLNQQISFFTADNAGNLANVIKQNLTAQPPKVGTQSDKITFFEQIKPLVQALESSAKGWDDKAAKEAFAAANSRFYKQGNISSTLSILHEMKLQGVKFDKPKRDFQGFIEGFARLKGGWPLPPRQPNAGLMTRRRHALYCLHQSVPHTTNGYSTRSHGIAVGLQQAGWTVRATTRPGFPWDAGAKGLNKGYHEANVDGVAYAAVAGWNLNKTPLDYYLAEAADHYVREAQTSGAEVIIAASNHITALPALMAARRLGLPFVYEVRGLWEVTQASTQPEWADSERFHLMRELEQQAAREADLVITLTHELATELESWGVKRESIVVIPNAVNAETFVPTAPDPAIIHELKLKPGVPVIGYAGSAVAYEGLELLMEAMAKLKQNQQDFIFVLVGDGKVIDTVKAKAKALGIEEHCRFTGRVPFDAVPRYLSCMDIMPVPRLSSAVTEMVSPLKPLEAMAMGKAVVLSDVSPHKVMAGENQRALLFKKDSVESLTQALTKLITRPEERARLGQAAREWIEKERTWNFVTNNYHHALQRVLDSQQSSTTPAAAKSLDQITLGLIADQFTTDTLASGVNVVKLSPENWQQELADQPIDALFVESAWKGNDWVWHRRVGFYGEEEFAPLRALLAHCRDKGIPSLFWNKEDPVHFDRFRKAASLCDHVFTTDSRRIIPYLTTPGALTQSVSSCAFYASPKIHNLLPSKRAWQPTAAYGGTYYGKRYPERTEYMDKIMSAAAPLGLTIYDRQHDDPESPYKYPGGLGSYVAGSLSYEEMIEAYKAHPVQINVNSVLDSPTMFSRRVMEAAACGAPILSGPALGMNRYLEEAGHVVRTEADAAQALENLMHHDAYRWRVALKGARAVMRAHTTQTRLTQMLRTAGMVVKAPELPSIKLYCEAVSVVAAKNLVNQTILPSHIVATHWVPGAKELLEAVGATCQEAGGALAQAGEYWLYAELPALESLEAEDIEDLAWTTTYASHTRVGFIRDEKLESGGWPGVACESDQIAHGFQLIHVGREIPLYGLAEWANGESTLALRKPHLRYAQAPNVEPVKTVVIAGHDLKFIKPFYPYFTKAGMRLLLDFWSGHNQHNEIASKRLIRQADTVFCEWMLGNAIWYGKNKREDQKLVGRLHAQELRSALFEKVPFEAFERVTFVGPHMLRQAIARCPALEKNGVVIYNGVDVEALQAVPRKPTNGKVLGIVGIVPESKRLDRALDILKELRREDAGYTLRVKGKRPEEFPWMLNRPEEMAWYEEQYRRLEEDPLLKEAVFFDPQGNDMPEWYSGIDFILSVSDHESFHLAVAEGVIGGCMPVISTWEGADEIYPIDWVFDSVSDMITYILSADEKLSSIYASQSYAKSNFDLYAIQKNICSQLL